MLHRNGSAKTRAVLWRLTIMGLLAAVLVIAIAGMTSTHTAYADSSNTRNDPFGTLELSGSQWLGGQGVDIRSNGSSAEYDSHQTEYVTVNGRQIASGERWQCVEMVNRLYLTRGWITNTWSGNGNSLISDIPAGLTEENNGAITYLNPGDVVTLYSNVKNADGSLKYPDGHAAIVNTVSGNVVQMVNQNTFAVTSTATLSHGNLTMQGWKDFIVQAVIHHPSALPPPSQDPSQPAFYANKIVQWNGDTKAQKTAWLVKANLKRYWIPDISTFYCLEGMGYTFAGPISSQLLDQLPDQTGNWATCNNGSGSGPTTQPPTPTPPSVSGTPPTPTPPPVSVAPPTPTPVPPQTWTEQEGSYGANSFSNPHNASGMGPHLDAMAYVQVSCKLYDPYIASVNPDGYWYRIASAPWNNGYYVAANTFWNGDIPGQKPYTHNTDWNVPNC